MNNGASSSAETVTQLQTLIQQVKRSEGDFSEVIEHLKSDQRKMQAEMDDCRQQIRQYQNDLEQVRLTHQTEWQTVRHQVEQDTSAHLDSIKQSQTDQHLRTQKQHDALTTQLHEALKKGQTSASATDSTMKGLTEEWHRFQNRSEKEFADCLVTLPQFAQSAAQEASQTVWGQVNDELTDFAQRAENHEKRLADLERQQISVMGHLNGFSRDMLRLKQDLLTTSELTRRTWVTLDEHTENAKEQQTMVQAGIQRLDTEISEMRLSWWRKLKSKSEKAKGQ